MPGSAHIIAITSCSSRSFFPAVGRLNDFSAGARWERNTSSQRQKILEIITTKIDIRPVVSADDTARDGPSQIKAAYVDRRLASLQQW